MRTTRFRGKRVDSEMWVYGDLLTLDVHEKGKPVRDGLFISIDSGRFKFEVIPETVGQFTGRVDKNGVEVYEGNVIQFLDIEICPTDRTDIKTVRSRIVVKWDENLNGWNLPRGYKNDWDFIEVKIVGNEFDNPELIKDY